LGAGNHDASKVGVIRPEKKADWREQPTSMPYSWWPQSVE